MSHLCVHQILQILVCNAYASHNGSMVLDDIIENNMAVPPEEQVMFDNLIGIQSSVLNESTSATVSSLQCLFTMSCNKDVLMSLGFVIPCTEKMNKGLSHT